MFYIGNNIRITSALFSLPHLFRTFSASLPHLFRISLHLFRTIFALLPYFFRTSSGKFRRVISIFSINIVREHQKKLKTRNWNSCCKKIFVKHEKSLLNNWVSFNKQFPIDCRSWEEYRRLLRSLGSVCAQLKKTK